MEPVREGEKHPLENPDILSLIFEGASLGNLKSWRQVCQLWAVESSKKMRSRTKVRIRDGEADQNLAALVDLISREESMWTEVPPSTFYSLDGGPADNELFWRLLGDHVRRLSLSNVTFQSVDDFLEAILKSSPNLEHLHLLSIKITSQATATKRVEGVPSRLLSNASVKTLACDSETAVKLKALGVRILEHFPSLHTLHVNSSDRSICGGDELIRSIAEIREDNPAILNLKHVDLNFQDIKSPHSLLPALVDSGLQLEGISVRFHQKSLSFDRDELEVTQKLIEAHAGSLQELLITSSFPFPPYALEEAIQPPKNGNFSRLKKFHFEVVRRMRILRLFPNLRELNVIQMEPEDLAFLGDMDIKPEVTKLSLFWPQNMDIRLIARCFPNVEELKLTDASSDQFPLVCELWPGLKSLWWDSNLLVEETECLDDAVITGYDVQDVEKINREGSASPWRPITVRKRNITSLTNLESFVWTNCFAPLNYCSAIDGVLMLPKLKNLVVWNPSDRRELMPSEVWREALERFRSMTPPPPFGDQSKRWWE